MPEFVKYNGMNVIINIHMISLAKDAAKIKKSCNILYLLAFFNFVKKILLLFAPVDLNGMSIYLKRIIAIIIPGIIVIGAKDIPSFSIIKIINSEPRA